jgi:hypothetical protein
MEAEPNSNRWERMALAVWLVGLLTVLIKLLMPVLLHGAAAQSEKYGGVWPIFAGAGQRWLSGQDLYRTPIKTDYFRYSPTAAVLFVPFTVFPEWFGGLVWRALAAGVLGAGLAAWLRSALGASVNRNQRAIVFLLVAPFAIANLNLGQSNVLLLGLLLLGLHAISGERWWLAAVCLAAACFLKVYPISILLLLCLVCPRRFVAWSAAALPIGLLLPFAFQESAYVLGQYESWWNHLQHYDRREVAPAYWNRDFRLLCEVCGANLSERAFLLISLLVAAFCAGVVWWGQRRGQPRRELLITVLALGCSWMTVFGMATESATYLLLIPGSALLLVAGNASATASAQDRGSNGVVRSLALPATATLLAAVGYGLLLVAQLAVWFPGGRDFHALAPQPLAGLILFASFLVTQFQFLTRAGSKKPGADLELQTRGVAA